VDTLGRAWQTTGFDDPQSRHGCQRSPSGLVAIKLGAAEVLWWHVNNRTILLSWYAWPEHLCFECGDALYSWRKEWGSGNHHTPGGRGIGVESNSVPTGIRPDSHEGCVDGGAHPPDSITDSLVTYSTWVIRRALTRPRRIHHF